MKARITEKEHSEVEVVRVSDTNSIVEAAHKVPMCNDENGDHLELPKLESNEVVGLRVVLAALEESAARHDSQLSKVRAQSTLKEQEHREMVEKLRFHDSQYSVL
jgi:hypothetical protein